MPQMPEPAPEFSRPVPRERLGGKVIVEEIAATPQERAALARRFGLLGLDLLAATLRVEPGPGARPDKGLLRLEGHLSAEVTQACVVTLEPVPSRIEADFTLDYSLEPDPALADAETDYLAEVVIDPEAAEPPESLGPGGLDLGEAVAQQLAVALDPYPRAPEAVLPDDVVAEGPDAAASGPFAVLEALKKRE